MLNDNLFKQLHSRKYNRKYKYLLTITYDIEITKNNTNLKNQRN